jgi:levansucrase
MVSRVDLPPPARPVPSTPWTQADLAHLSPGAVEIPLITEADVRPVLPGFDLWDVWPLQDLGNAVARIGDGEIWLCLAVPAQADPEWRHDVARVRALFKQNGTWRDLGNLFPDDLNPGSREWSGSAVFDPETSSVTAYFTATGRRGETRRTFEQRLFVTEGRLDWEDDLPSPGGWSTPVEIAINDGRYYRDVREDAGVPGALKGYRDPGFFVDPVGGATFVFFAASLAEARHSHDGAIGAAVAETITGPFELLAPVVAAEGVSNEMERPHMVHHDGRYYLFWSCHGASFAPDGPRAPTGLYGMVGSSPLGPFVPLNGSGLVLANPEAEPFQGYCWQVLDSLEVVSFVNYWDLGGRSIDDVAVRRARFGGTLAPVLKIDVRGDTTSLVGAGG